MDSLRNYFERMLRIVIFYIVLHTANSALEYGYEKGLDDQEITNYGRQSKPTRYDQILSNLHSLFKERTSDKNDNSKSVDNYNDFNYKPNKEVIQQFDEVLAEVTSALDKIKKELIKFNIDGDLTVDVPVTKAEKRYKRDVANDTAENITTTEKNDAIDVTTTETSATVTEPVELLAVKNESSVKRENSLPYHDVINKTDTPLNSRRMLSMMAPPPEYVTTTSRVKDKLLSYLEDTFNEVERKIKPLANIKIALSNDDHYRIGYIIATIDTLEVNLKKLKNDMNLHQHIWDDEKILNLFDRIKATNTVTTTLIESLKKYLPRN